MGVLATNQIRKGDIAFLKNAKPPTNSWEYTDLLKYKNDLSDPNAMIFSGDFIGPSNDEAIYSYNFFAYKKTKDNDYDYYFAAIISIDISSGYPVVKNQYLFTQKEGLKSWWSHVFGLYHTGMIDRIPKRFQYVTCPPPPFKSE